MTDDEMKMLVDGTTATLFNQYARALQKYNDTSNRNVVLRGFCDRRHALRRWARQNRRQR
jgi:hypothetical protein